MITCRRGGRRRFAREKWTGKSEREQEQTKAAQQQKPEMFELAATRHLRRRWPQKHDRAERNPFARGAPNQMKKNRPGDGRRAEQKPWNEKIHGDGAN